MNQIFWFFCSWCFFCSLSSCLFSFLNIFAIFAVLLWYSSWDSNSDWIRFELIASASWARGACGPLWEGRTPGLFHVKEALVPTELRADNDLTNIRCLTTWLPHNISGRGGRNRTFVSRLPMLQRNKYRFCGGIDEDRTRYLLNANQALSQMSYDPIWSGRRDSDPWSPDPKSGAITKLRYFPLSGAFYRIWTNNLPLTRRLHYRCAKKAIYSDSVPTLSNSGVCFSSAYYF